MKKLTVAFLLSLACSNAFGMQEQETTDHKTEVQETLNTKTDFAKGLVALAGAGAFGYLYYFLLNKAYAAAKEYNSAQNFWNNYIEAPIVVPLLTLLPGSKLKCRLFKDIERAVPVLAAVFCAKYGVSKISSVVASKTPQSIKQRLSSVKTSVTTTV